MPIDPDELQQHMERVGLPKRHHKKMLEGLTPPAQTHTQSRAPHGHGAPLPVERQIALP